MSARHKRVGDLTKKQRRERERHVLWKRRQEREGKPMTEQEWLASADPTAMLDWLTPQMAPSSDRPRIYERCPSERKLRLFACACRRLERHMEWVAGNGWYENEVDGQPFDKNDNMPLKDAHLFLDRKEKNAEQAAILRDIVGNPYRPAVIRASDPGGAGGRCIWVEPQHRTAAVIDLATAAYSERQADGTLDNGRLAVLSECLEEAGCDCGELLAHLRDGVAHYRGAWGLDLLLGKE